MGLRDANTIDIVSQLKDGGLALCIVDNFPENDSEDERNKQLVRKLNTYASYISNESSKRKIQNVIIEIHCYGKPTDFMKKLEKMHIGGSFNDYVKIKVEEMKDDFWKKSL